MGKFDEGCKVYFDRPERFAALCNYLFYNHRPVLGPQDITEADTAEITGRSPQKTRDLLRSVRCRGSSVGVKLIFVGLEAESYVDYSEPVKVMSYDAGRYNRQVQRIKNERKRGNKRTDFLSPIGRDDRLAPVVTIVLCLTDGEWDGPRCLHDILDIPPEVTDYVSDYRLNIINPRQMSDEEIEKFTPDLRAFLGFVKHSADGENLQNFIDKNVETYKIVDEETYDIINLYSGDKLPKAENGGGQRMCKAIDEIIEHSEARGEARGKAAGIAEGKAAGILEGKVSSVDELMKNSGMELAKACAMLSITVDEYNGCRALTGATA